MSKHDEVTLWERTIREGAMAADHGHMDSRNRLLIAISEAETMGFDATRQALIRLLQTLEAAYGSEVTG
jgi:hypothetical protein